MANPFIADITSRVIADPAAGIFEEEALKLAALPDADLPDLIAGAHAVTAACDSWDFFTCTIINAKSGRCSQDCAFCAQSSRHDTGVATYPLLSKAEMVARAMEMDRVHATHFSMVTSGPRLNDDEIDIIADAAADIRAKTKLSVCCSLGMITARQAKKLRASGVTRYHHNLETARSFFPEICTTHDYDEDIDTLKTAAAAGLSVCSGGIMGLGESWSQRVELAFTLKSLNVPRVPINFLNPISGTRLANRPLLSPLDALKSIALFRFILPAADITICGGREPTLKDFQSWVFPAGANGLMIGNYLTTRGRDLAADLEMIAAWQGLRGR
jgi:biotin synthase